MENADVSSWKCMGGSCVSWPKRLCVYIWGLCVYIYIHRFIYFCSQKSVRGLRLGPVMLIMVIPHFSLGTRKRTVIGFRCCAVHSACCLKEICKHIVEMRISGCNPWGLLVFCCLQTPVLISCWSELQGRHIIGPARHAQRGGRGGLTQSSYLSFLHT